MTEASIRGQKGMTSVKEMPVLQDGPPGGFPAVRYARRIANTGPSGLSVLLVSSAVIGWGLYQVGQGNIYRRGLKAEKIAARQAILPLIQAEEDARFVREKRSFWRKKRLSWQMCLAGRWVKMCTTLAGGCLLPLANLVWTLDHRQRTTMKFSAELSFVFHGGPTSSSDT